MKLTDLREEVQKIRFVRKGNHEMSKVELYNGDKKIGEIQSFIDGMASRNVSGFFGEQAKHVRRISSISISDEFRNKGYGKLLYLTEMARYPDAWFYNSQASSDADRTMQSLEKQGLIEYRVKTRHEDEIGIHIKRITQAGVNYIQSMFKKRV